MAVTILVTGFGPFPGRAVQSDRAAGRSGWRACGGRPGGCENRSAHFPDPLRGGRSRPAQADRPPQAGCAADVRAGDPGENPARRDARAQCADAAGGRQRQRAAASCDRGRRSAGDADAGAEPPPACGHPRHARAGACCRAMPGAICATTCAGAPPRWRASKAARASPPSCTYRPSRAAPAGRASGAGSPRTIWRRWLSLAGRSCSATFRSESTDRYEPCRPPASAAAPSSCSRSSRCFSPRSSPAPRSTRSATSRARGAMPTGRAPAPAVRR